MIFLEILEVMVVIFTKGVNVAKRKLRRHDVNVNVVALTINTQEVAPTIGLAAFYESQGLDGDIKRNKRAADFRKYKRFIQQS